MNSDTAREAAERVVAGLEGDTAGVSMSDVETVARAYLSLTASPDWRPTAEGARDGNRIFKDGRWQDISANRAGKERS